MSPQFSTGTLVEYAGIRWRVQRALGVEAVLLRSDAGEEVSADPLKLRLPDVSAPVRPARPVVDELRYSDGDWAEATRRRDLLAALASKTPRTTADVAAVATCLDVSPRRVWELLRRTPSHCSEITPFLPLRRGARAKTPECRWGSDHSAGHRPALRQASAAKACRVWRTRSRDVVGLLASRRRPPRPSRRASGRVIRSGWFAGARVRARPVRSPC
jgi:hypothetical protein